MNVVTTIDNAFTTEWTRLTSPEQYWHLYYKVDKAYVLAITLAVDAIQATVDLQTERAENRELSQRYHARNLRVLAYHYANILFELVASQSEHDAMFDESIYGVALKKLKGENINCSIYPCIPSSSNLYPEVEIYVPAT